VTVIWVAADGTYGDGHVAIISTVGWTQSDFDELAEAPDCTRLELARTIAASYLAEKS
jgi:hypothetical protein